MITDEQSLVRVTSTSGRTVRHWDDGFGPLWVYRESLGVLGVVRAQTWHDAWECVVDEILADADMDDPDNFDEDGCPAEGVHWRGSGVPSNDGLDSPLAREDPNGSLLEPLTAELAEELSLLIELEDA